MGFIELILTLILLVAFLSLVVFFILILYALVFGAPFAPLAQNRIDTMVELLSLKAGQKLVDLGSGDGRIVITFAKAGIEAHGYEINPLLVAYSRYRIRKLELQKKALIHFKDFWRADINSFDGVTIYGITNIMGRLEKKLMGGLRPGSKIVTNYFKFPIKKPVKTLNNVSLYVK